MKRCDFSNIMSIMKEHISENFQISQIKFITELFESFLNEPNSKDFILDEGQVCRWINGQAKISISIIQYYSEPLHLKLLANTIENKIFPLFYDIYHVIQLIYELLMKDNSISEQKKQELSNGYPFKTQIQMAVFIANMLYFGMSRTFIPQKALKEKSGSAVLRTQIIGHDIPKPCRWFCGREHEIQQIDKLLQTEGKLFLSGIAGIGKSELAKAYAYSKHYKNMVYIAYTGDLKHDITSMTFIDDYEQTMRFKRHEMVLSSLEDDSLILIDNINTTLEDDPYIMKLLNYRCHVLLTTRSYFEDLPQIFIKPFANIEDSLNLISYFYPIDNKEQIIPLINAVHGHTFAVEMIGRLLKFRNITPSEIYNKIKIKNMWVNLKEKIRMTKDGTSKRETYYQHIHMLFSLFKLNKEQKYILSSLSLMPCVNQNFELSIFAEWLELKSFDTIIYLIDIGLIQSENSNDLKLSPIIMDIIQADLPANTTNCHVLLEHIENICLSHNAEYEHYEILFKAIDIIIEKIDIKDKEYFIRFLDNLYPYMDKYQYYSGIKHIKNKLHDIFKDNIPFREHAIILECEAILALEVEHNFIKAKELWEQAVNILPETEEYLYLCSNLHGNLGNIYLQLKDFENAMAHMEHAFKLLKKCDMINSYDAFIQVCNYSELLIQTGNPQKVIEILQPYIEGIDYMPPSNDLAILLNLIQTAYTMVEDFEKAEFYNKTISQYSIPILKTQN